MNCGQPAPAVAVPAGGPVSLVQVQPKGNAGVWWALGTILAIAAVLFGLGAAGILRLRSADKAGPMLVQPGPDQGKLLAKRAEDPPPILQRNQDDPIRMPDDVRAWLEHLERIEKENQKLQEDQALELLAELSAVRGKIDSKSIEGLIDTGESTDQTTGSSDIPEAGLSDFVPIERMSKEWKELRRKFNQDGPPCPEECKPLKDEFDGALAQVPGVMSDVMSIAGNLFDQDKASKLKDAATINRDHKNYIDKALRQSDRMVGEICDRYKTRKWFEIKDGNIKGIMGLSGLF